MTRARITTTILATTAFGALLGGCATSLETGPGYYHYDVRPAGEPPAVVYHQPVTTVEQPTVVYQNPPVVYSQPPAIIYRSGGNTAYDHDHGQ
jgi:hypothetical protein